MANVFHAPSAGSGWRLGPGLLRRAGERGRDCPAVAVAVVAGLGWLAWQALQGVRIEELAESASYVVAIFLAWRLCLHDVELLRLAGMVAALVYVWLILI